MKKIISSLFSITLLLVLASSSAHAQCPATPVNNCDLVDNGNFETNSGMPVSGGYAAPGQLTLACPWNSVLVNGSSPDYFNAGATGTFGVPGNVVGSENARSGNGYGGFASYFQPVPGLREYMAEPLRCALIANVTYNLTFYVSLADNSQWPAEVSAAVCNTLPSIGGTGAISPVCTPANMVTLAPFTNKINWTAVNLTFVATGGEQFIVIGNFNSVDPGASSLAGTYPGSYVYVDDVSIIPVQNLSITATPSTVACGGTSTLSNNYGAPINYLSGAWNCAGCVNATTAPLTATTTFLGIIQYCTGCIQIASTAVTVTPMTISATATPSTISPPTTTSSVLSASASGGTGITYSWSPAASLNNPSIANPVATPTVTTVYTVTATNSAGCTAVTTVTVTVNPQSLCTLTYDYVVPNGAVSSSFFPSLTGLTGKNINVQGLFTIDAGFNFTGCNLVMEPNSRIQVINGGSVLYITGQTHIYSCSAMWDGIYLGNGTSAQIMNASIIEDAIKAVKIDQGATATIDLCIFNRNYTAVELTSNTSTTSPLTMTGNVVTCRNIPFSSVVSANPTAAAVWANIVASGFASINMKTPFTSYKSIYGVFATDVNTLKVGSDIASSHVNGFDNLASTGIYLTRSNTTIYNNRFRKITSAATCGTCTPLLGMGICGIGNTTTNYSIKIGGILANQPNTFTDVFSSVDVSNYQLNNVRNNTITNATSTTGSVGGFGKNGIRISPMISNTVNVSGNTITNCNAGIAITRNFTTAGQTVNLTVDNNSINAVLPGFCTTGISLSDNTSAVLTSATSEINFNTIVESANCISLLNVKATNNVLSNSCMTRYVGGTTNINGIKLSGCQAQTVMQNHTKYNVATAGLAGGNIFAYGIYLLNSPNNAIRCNLIEDAARSLVFSGNCSSPNGITQNTFRRAQDGMVLLTVGTSIGTQGSAANPSDNYWDLTSYFTNTHLWTMASPSIILWVNPMGTFGPATETEPSWFGGMGVITLNYTATPPTPPCGPVPARLAAPEESQEVVTDANEILFVYPNPSNGSFTLETHSTAAKDIFVYDVMGKVVSSAKQISDSNILIDITEQPSGMYIIQVITGNSVETKRVIRQ